MSEPLLRPASLAMLFGLAPSAAVVAPDTALHPAPDLAFDMVAERASAHAAGFAAGAAAAEGDLAPVRLRLIAAAAALEAACQIDVATLQPVFVALVTRLAETVVAAELALAPGHIVALVDVALESVRLDPAMVLHVHPDDAALLAGEALPLPVESDAAQPRGSVFVAAPQFVVADSFAARLVALIATLP